MNLEVPENFLPVRGIATFLFCPRLSYFQLIEKNEIVNEHVLEGRYIHTNIDKGNMNKTNIRSFVLQDKDLGLSGVIDELIVQETEVIPVEYKKGKPHKIYIENEVYYVPWEEDYVQLGLYVEMLRNQGKKVNRGYFYYHESNQKIEMIYDDEIKEKVLSTLNSVKEMVSSGKIPAPLINDSRCHGCSLNPICLPDEINQTKNNEIPTMRRIWPPRTDGILIFVQQQEAKIGLKGDSLIVFNKEGVQMSTLPMAQIDCISLYGNVQITTQALVKIKKENIPLVFCSMAGKMIVGTNTGKSLNKHLLLKQLQFSMDEEITLIVARKIIEAKVKNQRTLIMRHVSSIQDTKDILKKIVGDISKTFDVNTLRGLEGSAARQYFAQFGKAFNDPWGTENFLRRKRPATDPINAVLSFAYTMLANENKTACEIANLNSSLGIIHGERTGDMALALDLMEPFRPIIADSLVLTLFNRKQLTKKHFIQSGYGCLLTDEGRKIFFTEYAKKMNEEVTHPYFGYKLTYRRMIVLHALMLASYIRGDIQNFEFLTTK